MNSTDNLDYIAACELAECPSSFGAYAAAANPGLLKALDVTDAKPGNEAAVVAGSLLAFAAGMSAQSKQDVINSFLFATLVANKAFSAQTQGDQWYDKFNEVLSKLGWLSTQWNYARYRATHQRFTMDELGLEILGSAIAAAALPGPASLLMLKVAGDAIAALRAKKNPCACSRARPRHIVAVASVSPPVSNPRTASSVWPWQRSVFRLTVTSPTYCSGSGRTPVSRPEG